MKMSMRALFVGSGMVFSMLLVPPALSQTQFQDSGASSADILDTVDDFRNALGPLNAPGGRRQVVWDGVPDAAAVPMDFDQFRGAGALFTTPDGTSTQVSLNDDNDPTTPANPLAQFGDLNNGYPQIFEPFSGDQIFTAIDSNIVDVSFVLPGTDFAGLSRGLGVVFSDVDLANTTSIELFGATGNSLGLFYVPASPGNETFSFLGLLYDSPVISRARITNGNFELAPAFSDGTDLVAMDDFIFGEPVPEPSTWLALLAGLGGLVWLRRKSLV